LPISGSTGPIGAARRYASAASSAGRDMKSGCRARMPSADCILARAVDALLTEQRQLVPREPAQQVRVLAGRQRVGVGQHSRAHLRPVGHSGADVGEHRLDLGGKLAPVARIGAVQLDVDDRFGGRIAGVRPARGGIDRGQLPVRVARGDDHRMDQAVDGQPARGDRRRHAVDQKRHVVVDQRHAHAPLQAGGAALRFDVHDRRPGARMAAAEATNDAASLHAPGSKPSDSPGSALRPSAAQI
jgi:hypothetical protein